MEAGAGRKRKWRPRPSLRARQAIAHNWLGDRPVTCAIAAAADLSSGTKGETRKLYATWKEGSGTWGVSYPAFERTLLSLLAQPKDASFTNIDFTVWNAVGVMNYARSVSRTTSDWPTAA